MKIKIDLDLAEVNDKAHLREIVEKLETLGVDVEVLTEEHSTQLYPEIRISGEEKDVLIALTSIDYDDEYLQEFKESTN